MVTEKTLERINELYHKSKAEGLTDAELAEQKQLRADYVKAFRETEKNKDKIFVKSRAVELSEIILNNQPLLKKSCTS